MTAWRSLIPTWEISTISFWEGLLKIPLPVLLSWAYFNFPFIFEGQFLVNIKSPVDSLFLAVFWRCHTLLSAFQGCWWEASCWSNGKIPVYDRWLLCCCSQNYLFVFDSLTVMCWGLTPLSLSYLESVPFLRCIDHFHKWSECRDIIFSFFFRLPLPALSAQFSHYVRLIYGALLVCSLLAIVIFVLFSEATISAELLSNSVFLPSTFETLYWTCCQLLSSSAPACLLGFQKQLLTIYWYFLINKMMFSQL